MSDGLVQVATASGIVEVTGDKGLHTGDVVIVQNGQAIKKHLDGTAQVFFV